MELLRKLRLMADNPAPRNQTAIGGGDLSSFIDKSVDSNNEAQMEWIPPPMAEPLPRDGADFNQMGEVETDAAIYIFKESVRDNLLFRPKVIHVA